MAFSRILLILWHKLSEPQPSILDAQAEQFMPAMSSCPFDMLKPTSELEHFSLGAAMQPPQALSVTCDQPAAQPPSTISTSPLM